MKRRVAVKSQRSATATNRWAKKLAADVAAVISRHPDADPEDVRLTLISLQSPPLERLNRSLRRGRGFAAFRR
jgi:septum formation topological specificity factor MinE